MHAAPVGGGGLIPPVPHGPPLVILRAGSARLRSTSSDPSLVCAMFEPLTGRPIHKDGKCNSNCPSLTLLFYRINLRFTTSLLSSLPLRIFSLRSLTFITGGSARDADLEDLTDQVLGPALVVSGARHDFVAPSRDVAAKHAVERAGVLNDALVVMVLLLLGMALPSKDLTMLSS